LVQKELVVFTMGTKRKGTSPAASGIRKKKQQDAAAAAAAAEAEAEAAEHQELVKYEDIPPMIRKQVLEDEELISELHKDYIHSKPYAHGVIYPLVEDDLMRKVWQEIKSHMVSNMKETDLYKVFQTGDLKNFDVEENPQISHLLKLRDTLYSKEFRQVVEKITGCSHLTDQTDCAVNAYVQGCHLICHDDVISTRCVSYIIYFQDPDEEWEEKDGGNLELYGLMPGHKEKYGVPDILPDKRYLPLFNRMVMFTVLPGQSYHAVQEVYAQHKPRITIQGWYHGTAPPEGAQKISSLAQLMTTEKLDHESEYKSIEIMHLHDDNDDEAAEADAEAEAEVEAEGKKSEQGADKEAKDKFKLHDDIVKVLKPFVNPVYLESGNAYDIRKKFVKESFIELRDFLHPDIADKLAKLIEQQDVHDKLGGGQTPDYKAGYENKSWKPMGPTHVQRYMRLLEDHRHKGELERILAKVQKELILSDAFASYLHAITGLHPEKVKAITRRFRPGIDYTVAHMGNITAKKQLDATLVFADCSTPGKYSNWEDEDVGGFECYIEKDEDSALEASAVYKQSINVEDGPLVNFQASFNTLCLVCRDEGVMRFVKYLSCHAPGSRWDISSEFVLQAQDYEDDEAGDDDAADDDDDDDVVDDEIDPEAKGAEEDEKGEVEGAEDAKDSKA